MAKQVKWTKRVLEEFIDKAMLNADEIFIMENRIKGMTISRMAIELHKSESTVHNMVRVLKEKYDLVQGEYPDIFPVRKTSKAEEYMDNN